MLKQLLLKSLLTVSGLFLMATTLQAAELALQPDSSVVSFVSIKKEIIAETHTFKTVSGSIKDNQTMVTILADSVDTAIDIRNTRLKRHIFNVEKFAEINISADTSAVMAELKAGQPKLVDLPATLSLIGMEKEITLSALVLKSADGSILVTSTKPILISAADFGLTEGVKKLGELAGGITVAAAVPVSFTLYFK